METQNEITPQLTPETPAGDPTRRLTSLDAYRGFTMLLMAMATYRWLRIAEAFPDSDFWKIATHQLEHVPWAGWSIWDMIQPSFMFMVGVSMPYSYGKRHTLGQSYGYMLGHAVYRSLVLVLLGVFLRSMGTDTTYWTFVDVLTQIGLGYVFLFLLWNRPWKLQWSALALILVGYWALFALWPLPAADYDVAANGVTTADLAHQYTGFQAHWNKNANPAHYFDQWFLNLFPRPTDLGAFEFSGGGYQTLNFIPSLATMLLGMLAGQLIRSSRSDGRKLLILVGIGIAGIAIGKGIEVLHLCPIVKRIWTPSWAIFSGGICFLLLAGFYGVIDLIGLRRWAFPGVVVGMNSIAIYAMTWTIPSWIHATIRRHFGEGVFRIAGETYEPFVETATGVFVMWVICYWMYRRKLYLRI